MIETTEQSGLPEPAPDAQGGTVLGGITTIPGYKILLVSLLALFMLIPMIWVGSLIQERQQRQTETLAAFQHEWGARQSVAGPLLVVPYETSPGLPLSYLHIAPDQLSMTGNLHPEIRKRGIFRATVYAADLDINGSFKISHIPVPSDATHVNWRDAMVVLNASDFRGGKSALQIAWDGQMLPFDDHLHNNELACERTVAVAAHVVLPDQPTDLTIPFQTHLDLRGTQSLRVLPLAQRLDMKLSGNWSTPDFAGVELPASETVSDRGFIASWQIANNITKGTGVWASRSIVDCNNGSTPLNAEDQIGVELLDAVPTYRMVERSSKYGVLFLALSFLTYFLFEMISSVRIHLVQYGLLGLSLSMFTLLLISFSEPLGFAPAYAISTMAVVLQASLFTGSVTRRFKHAFMFAVILGLLFGFLYIVLSLESYSLLAGSVALFAILSAVMVVTRNIDWSRSQAAIASSLAPPPSAAQE